VVIENKNIPGRSQLELSEKDTLSSLYKGDIMDTTDGKVIFTLNGGIEGTGKSILSLAPGTKLEINRHVCDSKQKIRSSFINMISGTARFRIGKLGGWNSEFKVKTEWVVARAEGSDFILSHTGCTILIAFEDTYLNVQPLYEEKRVSLKSSQYVEVCKGQESVAKNVKQEELEKNRTDEERITCSANAKNAGSA